MGNFLTFYETWRWGESLKAYLGMKDHFTTSWQHSINNWKASGCPPPAQNEKNGNRFVCSNPRATWMQIRTKLSLKVQKSIFELQLLLSRKKIQQPGITAQQNLYSKVSISAWNVPQEFDQMHFCGGFHSNAKENNKSVTNSAERLAPQQHDTKIFYFYAVKLSSFHCSWSFWMKECRNCRAINLHFLFQLKNSDQRIASIRLPFLK